MMSASDDPLDRSHIMRARLYWILTDAPRCLEVWSGTMPPHTEDSVPAPPLFRLALPEDWLILPGTDKMGLSAQWQEAQALATGIPSWWRITQKDGTVDMQGDLSSSAIVLTDCVTGDALHAPTAGQRVAMTIRGIFAPWE